MNGIIVIKKYWQIYLAMFKASAISDLEYRANFFLRFITDVFWYFSQVLTFEVLFNHAENIGGWHLAEMRVFLGILFVIDALFMIFVHENIDHISEKVQKGDLDLILAKPINSQFMLSFQKANLGIIGNLIMGILWLIFALKGLQDFNPLRLLWPLILIPCSLMIMYSLRFALAATAVIFVRSENMQFIWWPIYRLGMRPDSIYHPYIRYLFLSIIPVGVIISIPARALIYPPEIPLLLIPLFTGPFLVYLSHLFWKYSLKFYSSASS